MLTSAACRRLRVITCHARSAASASATLLPADPLAELGGIEQFAAALRCGQTTAVEATQSYLRYEVGSFL